MERPLDPARLGDHFDRLYRAAWALCGSREDAEDLVQETYARALARPRLLRSEDDLGYLLRALRNTFLTQKRTERRRLRPGPLPDQLDLVADPYARQPQAALEAGELYAAVAALPGDFRDVLVAVDITGLTAGTGRRATTGRARSFRRVGAWLRPSSRSHVARSLRLPALLLSLRRLTNVVTEAVECSHDAPTGEPEDERALCGTSSVAARAQVEAARAVLVNTP
ncbi:MAG: RNA polymerase sigma factor [Gaiellaceae bacterium]